MREVQAFATLDNVSSCVASLNRSLADRGLPGDLVLTGLPPAQAAATCNSLYAVLTQLQRATDGRSAAVEAQRRLLGDLSRVEKALLSARASEGAARDEAAAATRRQRAAAAEHQAAQSRLVVERNEALKERNNLAFKLAQLQTDLKRRERDAEMLVDKLRSALDGKTGAGASGRGPSVRGATTPGRAGTESEPVSPGRPDSRAADFAAVETAAVELYRTQADGLRAQLDASQGENRELCAALAAIRDELRAMRATVGAPPPGREEEEEGVAAGSDDEAFAAHEAGASGMLRNTGALPFTLGGAATVGRIRRDVRALRAWCAPSPGRVNGPPFPLVPDSPAAVCVQGDVGCGERGHTRAPVR